MMSGQGYVAVYYAGWGLYLTCYVFFIIIIGSYLFPSLFTIIVYSVFCNFCLLYAPAYSLLFSSYFKLDINVLLINIFQQQIKVI